MFSDLTLALRSWARTPRLALSLVACIAVAIAGAATVLTFIYSILLRPLPYPHHERLVHITPANTASAPGGRPYLSYLNFADLRASARSFELFEGALVSRLVVLSLIGAERIRGETVTAGYFDLLGLRPQLGRLFNVDEYAGRGDKAVLLSHRIWRSHYAEDPTVVGQTIRTRTGPMVVVGVMPAGFVGIAEDDGTDYWLPERQHNHPAMLTARGDFTTLAFARLRHGVTLAQAQEEMATLATGLARAHPADAANFSIALRPLAEIWRAGFRGGLVVMLVASLLLLAIGCGNVAVLQLARLLTRERELAVRLSLGANRRQLLRLLLAESAVLAAAGGSLGLCLSLWLNSLFLHLSGAGRSFQLPNPVEFGTGPLALCLGVVLLSTFGFGLLPAWIASRLDAAAALRSGGRGLAAGALQGLTGRLLIGGQAALAVTLLAGAALFLRSYDKLRHTDFGYRTENLLRMQVSLQRETYPAPETRAAFFQKVDAELRRLPGVHNIGYMSPTLPPWDPEPMAVRLQGGDFGTADGTVTVNQRFATNDAFSILGVPLRQGRWFLPSDRPGGGESAALVSEKLARRISPDGNVVGRVLTLAFNNHNVRIVGVVADARWNGQRNRNPSGFDLFLSMDQAPQFSQGVIFDSAVSARSLIDPARKAITALDPTVALHWIDTLDEALDYQTVAERFWTALAATYAGTAFLLAVLGIYGVLSHAVAGRRREIGVRLALGATPGSVSRMVLRQGLAVIALGCIAGLGLSLLAGRWIESKLHGVATTDPLALAVSVALLLFVAALTCLLPARRAARTDPIEALRAE